MRQIKFRGKRKDNGEWVFGYFYKENEETFIIEYRPDLTLLSGAPDNNMWWREVDPETVGDFIDPLDKDDKEIYITC